MTDMKHTCANTEVRTSRLLLALHTDCEDSFKLVVQEIGSCTRCWKAVALWAVTLLAGRDSRAAGSREQAAEFVLSELERVLSF
jgi:hypothetical protein